MGDTYLHCQCDGSLQSFVVKFSVCISDQMLCILCSANLIIYYNFLAAHQNYLGLGLGMIIWYNLRGKGHEIQHTECQEPVYVSVTSVARI